MFLCSTFLLSTNIFAQGSNFRTVGENYFADAVAEAPKEIEAINGAKIMALNAIFDSLQKDALFKDLFLKNPPISINFEVKKIERTLSGAYKASVTVKVDEESIRILYNGAYFQTVNNLLDKTELDLTQIEKTLDSAKKLEVNRKLGEAQAAYWQALDQCDAVLSYLSAIDDGSIMSTKDRKKAPELKAVIAGHKKRAQEGVTRLKNSEKLLVEDVELKNLEELIAQAEAETEKAASFLASILKTAANPEQENRSRLIKTRDDILAQIKLLDDAKLSLDRNYSKIPEDRAYLKSRLDLSFQRIARYKTELDSAYRSINLEITDPLIGRAEREAQIKWIFFHNPSDTIAFRMYLPFGLVTASNNTHFEYTARFDFQARLEGCFNFSDNFGLWLKTRLDKTDIPLSTSNTVSMQKNTTWSEEIDAGFYSGLLYGAGFAFDWLRTIDGIEIPKQSAYRLHIGAVDTKTPKNTALLTLSFYTPPEKNFVFFRDFLSFGLEGILRLGNVLNIEGKVYHKVLARNASANLFDSVFAYSLGAGFRLPAPFLWALEYTGTSAEALNGDGSSTGIKNSNAYFRMFLEYAL